MANPSTWKNITPSTSAAGASLINNAGTLFGSGLDDIAKAATDRGVRQELAATQQGIANAMAFNDMAQMAAQREQFRNAINKRADAAKVMEAFSNRFDTLQQRRGRDQDYNVGEQNLKKLIYANTIAPKVHEAEMAKMGALTNSARASTAASQYDLAQKRKIQDDLYRMGQLELEYGDNFIDQRDRRLTLEAEGRAGGYHPEAIKKYFDFIATRDAPTPEEENEQKVRDLAATQAREDKLKEQQYENEKEVARIRSSGKYNSGYKYKNVNDISNMINDRYDRSDPTDSSKSRPEEILSKYDPVNQTLEYEGNTYTGVSTDTLGHIIQRSLLAEPPENKFWLFPFDQGFDDDLFLQEVSKYSTGPTKSKQQNFPGLNIK